MFIEKIGTDVAHVYEVVLSVNKPVGETRNVGGQFLLRYQPIVCTVRNQMSRRSTRPKLNMEKVKMTVLHFDAVSYARQMHEVFKKILEQNLLTSVMDTYFRDTARSYEIPKAVLNHCPCNRVACLSRTGTVTFFEAYKMNNCFTLYFTGSGFDFIARYPVLAKTERPLLQGLIFV